MRMAEQGSGPRARIGVAGLGTMGSALALNIAESGFDVALWNRTPAVARALAREAGPLEGRLHPCDGLEQFAEALGPDGAAILMVPAGPPVDQTIAALRPLLGARGLIVDAGNADYHDSDRRAAEAGAFLGLGVSGGEEGARHGPSLMAGGAPEHWERIEDVMLAIAARHPDGPEGEPCAALLGPGGAGHFVKMVHNGIEYADMQMIAEIYGLMRDGLGWDHGRIGDAFGGWNEGRLRSYLVEITAEVCRAEDPLTGRPMPEIILDAAGQKGTGRWTVIESQEMGTPVPAVEAAVAARNLSARISERALGERRYGPAPRPVGELPLEDLEAALIAGKVICYAQGFSMLAATEGRGWSLPLPRIARIWRAGCIIRSAMLDDMAAALQEAAEEGAHDRNLILTPAFSKLLSETHGALRRVVARAADAGHPCPALGSGLAWFDTMRTQRGTANLIQAQRDFFGRHGFDRLDGREGRHGPWAADDPDPHT
jgi:6-phosphogluconate dehydrogenase